MTQGPRVSMSTVDVVAAAEFHPATNRWAVEITLEELANRDDLRPTDAGLVAAVRNLASAVDVDALNASLWRQYREALERLTADGDDDGPSFVEQLEAVMRGEVGDQAAAGEADAGR